MINIEYLLNFKRMENLQDAIGLSFFTELNYTKRATLWYLAGKKMDKEDALEYALYKVYGVWGIDSLTPHELKNFSLT
jgi:hypothetical protein